MAYEIGQYNKVKGIDDNIFMTPITSGVVKRRVNSQDVDVVGVESIFEDECIQVDNFSISNYYYFHGKIKRMTSDQTFYIKLVYFDASENKEQYIKTINVSKGNINEWVDVEFIFTPLAAFDCILFELQRISTDYKLEIRYPKIAYQELSIINNIISSKIRDGIKLIKLGIQSHPGLLMCINGEEIRTCRTGIYELKNGIITVPFFSVVAALKEDDTTMENWIDEINTKVEDIVEREEAGEITNEEAEAEQAAINSEVFFNTIKKSRVIDSFTLDYMYRKE